MPANPLTGLSYLLKRFVARCIVEPRRRAFYERQTAAFLYRNPDGLTFKLLPAEYVDRYIAIEGIYDGRLLAFIKSLLPKGAVMLDIGANIGNHALYLADCCAQIHCFEPNPTVAARLEDNIAANRASHISVLRFGLGSSDETLTFHENINGNLGASMFATSDKVPAGHRAVSLQIRHAGRAIDELGLHRVDLIKIDVEGMEAPVFEALCDVITRYRPLIAFEHHEQLADSGTFARIQACLPGYRLMEPTFAAHDAGWLAKILWNFRQAGQPVLLEVAQPERRSYENLLAFPS